MSDRVCVCLYYSQVYKKGIGRWILVSVGNNVWPLIPDPLLLVQNLLAVGEGL